MAPTFSACPTNLYEVFRGRSLAAVLGVLAFILQLAGVPVFAAAPVHGPRMAPAPEAHTYTTLPAGVRFLRNPEGYITTVAVDAEVRESLPPFGGILGSRYVPGSLDDTDVTPELWRALEIGLHLPTGETAELKLARPLWWLEGHGITQVGDEYEADLEELGIEAVGYVDSIGPCVTKAGPGEVVIGWIRRPGQGFHELLFEGSPQPVLVTAGHPLFSTDRNDWVPAGELHLGETVKTAKGTAKLLERHQSSEATDVYNIEVHRAHTFYVGDQQILAHNGPLGNSAAKISRVLKKEIGPKNARMLKKVAKGASERDAAGASLARADAMRDMRAAGELPAAPKMVLHHRVPKEVLRNLPEPIRNDPRIKGAKGTPNRVYVPQELHIKAHAGGYNQKFLELVRTARANQGKDFSADSVLQIRNQLMREYKLK